MLRGSRNWWLLLGILVGVLAWSLTLVITHVDHGPQPVITLAFDERPPFKLTWSSFDLANMQQMQQQIPEIEMASPARSLVLVTPATRSVTLRHMEPRDITCGWSGDLVGSSALWVSSGQDRSLTPIAVRAAGSDTVIPVPDRLHLALLRMPGSKGAISCSFRRRLAAAPTFTERSITVHADTGSSGALLVNVSALEDVDDLRFSGGLQLPFGGDRTRLLYGVNDAVSAEWSDVIAQERRDIVLVLIGALSAIAAATIIEAIRPWVEGKKTG